MTLSRISAVPLFLFLEFALFSLLAQALPPAQPTAHSWFVDCSSSTSGDGSAIHPWNTLAGAQAHAFGAGDRIALKRGTVCHGSFAPQGNGSAANPIRLTAYGEGQRPRIVATANDRQALLLFNQQYWQIDSLDISGGNTYGMFVTGDKGTLHHIYLKNLYVHDVVGGGLKNKDNGLVVVGPSSINVFFDDVLVDGVIAAHTNQWAGILIGGGNFPYAADAPLNTQVTKQNPLAIAFGTLAMASKSRDFWLLFFSFFICGASTNGYVGTHLIAMCSDHGLTEVQGASLLAAMGIFDLFGTTLSGWLSDRFNNRVLLFWYYGLRGLSLMYLPHAFGIDFFGLPIFALFYGLDWIATVPPTVRLATDVFGKEAAPVVFGWVVAGHQLGAAFAALGAGMLRASLGTYTVASMISGGLCLVASVIVLRINRGERPVVPLPA